MAILASICSIGNIKTNSSKLIINNISSQSSNMNYNIIQCNGPMSNSSGCGNSTGPIVGGVIINRGAVSGVLCIVGGVVNGLVGGGCN